MTRKFLAFLTLTIFSAHLLSAQKVGVVMSGGGAKGLYHIGVLQALEEQGIPIDYVAGTSMGSIVAALYAAGYSPAEMREIARPEAISQWMSGKINPQEYIPYYKRFRENPALLNVRFDLTNPEARFKIPTYIISSTQIDMALTELFASATAASGGDFNNLMVPFLCVASDMKSRQAVTLTHGNLSEAVRASMAIPLVFKPIERDSMLLYDGGIFDNYPWRQQLEEHSPDFIIGSICTEGNTSPDPNSSLLDQAFMLAMQDTNYDIPEDMSITINRAIDVNMLDFKGAQKIIDQGYNDTKEMMPEIVKKVRERRSQSYYEERREKFAERKPELEFNDFNIHGLDAKKEEYVRDYLRVDTKAKDKQKRRSFTELKNNLYEVLAGGNFAMEFPEVTFDTINGTYIFDANFKTRPSTRVTFGGNISSTIFNQAYIGLNYQRVGLVSQQYFADLYLGTLYTWGRVGGRTDFYSWQPLFLDYSINYTYRNFDHGAFGNITKADNFENVNQNEIFASVSSGFPLSKNSLLMLQINGGFVNNHYYTNELFVHEEDHSQFDFVGAKFNIEQNTLDKPLYPRRGSHLSLSAIYITGRDDYKPHFSNDFIHTENHSWLGARFTWDKYFDIPSCSWFSLGFNVDAVYTNLPQFSTSRSTVMMMPSYRPTQHSNLVYMPDFKAKHFVAGGIMPTIDFTPKFMLRTGFYTMYRSKYDMPPELKEGYDVQLQYMSEASLVYHTPLGPVSLSLTKYDIDSWNNMYLTFNFGYSIFADKATFY